MFYDETSKIVYEQQLPGINTTIDNFRVLLQLCGIPTKEIPYTIEIGVLLMWVISFANSNRSIFRLQCYNNSVTLKTIFLKPRIIKIDNIKQLEELLVEILERLKIHE